MNTYLLKREAVAAAAAAEGGNCRKQRDKVEGPQDLETHERVTTEQRQRGRKRKNEISYTGGITGFAMQEKTLKVSFF